MENKKCTGCKEVKPTSDFSKWSRGKDGLQNYCKICNRKYLKKFNVEYLPDRRTGDQSKSGSYLNHIWLKIIKRCTNPKDSHYHNYGGRGISVCDRWLSWDNFLEDMGGSFKVGLSIERVDVNGDYCLENCKWIPKEDQGLNKQDTIYITLPNKCEVGLAAHCRDIDFKLSTAYSRYLKYGDSYSKLFAEYLPRIKTYNDSVKTYIAENFHQSTAEIIENILVLFDIELTGQYVRQVKSDWKRGLEGSVLFKLFGSYEKFMEGRLTPTKT